jgi:hypothetical protein
MAHACIQTCRSLALALLLAVVPGLARDKKVVSPETSAGNEEVDLVATIFMTQEEATKELGMDPGPDIAILRVRVIPKTDKPVLVAADDFILLAHNDGERSKPFTPYEIAGQGALIVTNTADQKQAKQKKTSTMGGLGGVMMGGGGGGSDGGMASPGNPRPVTIGTKVDDKSPGNPKLLEALKAKQLPDKETSEPLEGLLYFRLSGKHKLKDMAVLYRGPAGKLNLDFEH